MSCGHVDGISRSCGWDNRSNGWDKEIPHGCSPMEKLVLSNKWARKLSLDSQCESLLGRFQDDDDIFGLSDAPARTRTPPKKSEDTLDWLEMATAGKTPDKQKEKTQEKPALKPPDPLDSIKPKSDPSSWLGITDSGKTDKMNTKSEQKLAVTAKPKSDPSDWLGLKDDDGDEEEFDYLKASSFSAPARQGPPQVRMALLEVFIAYQTRFSAIFTSADKSHPTYSYPTCGINKIEKQHVNTLNVE